jgi:hypothetical protein
VAQHPRVAGDRAERPVADPLEHALGVLVGEAVREVGDAAEHPRLDRADQRERRHHRPVIAIDREIGEQPGAQVLAEHPHGAQPDSRGADPVARAVALRGEQEHRVRQVGSVLVQPVELAVDAALDLQVRVPQPAQLVAHVLRRDPLHAVADLAHLIASRSLQRRFAAEERLDASSRLV